MNDINLGDIRVLHAVSEQGSILAAAEVLGISRSVARRRLKNLEAAVGRSLLQGNQSGAMLTAAGEVLLHSGQALLSDAAAMVTRAQHSEIIERPLRVVMPVGIPSSFVARLKLLIHGTMPNMRMSIREVQEPLRLLKEPLDLLFHFGPPPDRGVYFSRVLLRSPLRLLASPSYLEQHGVPETPAQLAGHDLLSWSSALLEEGAWPLIGGGTVAVKPWTASPNIQLLRLLVAQGGGIALLPDGGTFDEPNMGTPVPVLDGVVGGPLAFRVLAPRPTRTSPGIQRVLDMFLERVSALSEV